MQLLAAAFPTVQLCYFLRNAEGGVPYTLFYSADFALFLTASRRSQHSSPESFAFSHLFDSSYLTLFLTYAAAYAESVVHYCLAVAH